MPAHRKLLEARGGRHVAWEGNPFAAGDPDGALHFLGRSHQHCPSPKTVATASLKASRCLRPGPWCGPPVSAPGLGYCGLDPRCPIWPSVQHVWPGVGLDGQTKPACPSLGCGDNELIHSLSQSHEERDLLYQGLDVFPLSASKEPGPDNQKNNSQLASSWQAGHS